MKKRVLCLLAEGVEELELVAPVDVLRRAGSEVVLSLLGEDPYIKGRNGMMLRGDRPLNGLAMEDFDLLLIPGGAAVDIFRSDGRPSELAKKFFGAGKRLPLFALVLWCSRMRVCLRGDASPPMPPWPLNYPVYKLRRDWWRTGLSSLRADPARL